MEYRSGAQCLVIRNNMILMVKHKHAEREYYTLPGGRIEEGETPEQAAIRELREECNVSGKVTKKLSEYCFPVDESVTMQTFLVEIENQTPVLGKDPELTEENQILAEVKWMPLDTICERDRAFLWASGLLCIPQFFTELLSWSDDISFPNKHWKIK
jgi:ADP-ribose pyrophosphatase YjhB (NUDIX family)